MADSKRTSRSRWGAWVAAFPGVMVLAMYAVDRVARSGNDVELQSYSRSLSWIGNVLGMLSLPLFVLALLLARRSWSFHPIGGRITLALVLLLSMAGTLSYWQPMYDLFFGPWS